MKGLATAVIVIILLSVLTMGAVGYMFVSGYNPGKKQISRQQLVSTCQKLCAEDQEKIYQLKGHSGTLDLPNQAGGIMFLKQTSFCSKEYKVGTGQVHCDQITTCKVTDGDGDTGYLHCENSYHSSGGGGGGGGGSINVNGPIALGVPVGEKLLVCDKPGKYIKFYASTNKPLVGSKLKVWGIVCENGGPVANQKVMLSWDKIPLSKIEYYQGFDDINENNTHNLEVLKGWNLSDNFWVRDNTHHDNCNGDVNKCIDWFWNNIGDSGVISSVGHLSPYLARIYSHERAYPIPSMDVNYFEVPYYAQKADEVDMRIGASQGPRFSYKNHIYYLTLGGSVSEVVFELSNGTNTTFDHYIGEHAGCHPGLIWNCLLNGYVQYNGKDENVTQQNCSNLLNSAYQKIGLFKNLNWENKINYRNVTIPGNNSNNIFLFKQFKYWDMTRFKLIKPNDNYTLKKVYFVQYYFGVGGCGGVGILIEDFKIRKYINITNTNKFGMFNTTITVPMRSGLHNLSAKSIGSNIIGSLDVTSMPYIKVDFDTYQNNENLTVSGDIKYLNGSGVNNSALWILLDGKPYPDQKIIKEYKFDQPTIPDYFKMQKVGPSIKDLLSIENGYFNVTIIGTYSGILNLYYYPKNPQFIQNISFDINIARPYPGSGNNYSFYVGSLNEKNMKTEWYVYKYLSKNGSDYRGVKLIHRWPYESLLGYNLTLNEWHHIWFSPLNWIGNTENGEKRNLLAIIGGYSPDSHNLEILLDNFTVTNVGKTYANENGHFVIKIPKSSLSTGTHTITILAYDKLGAEAIKTESVNI